MKSYKIDPAGLMECDEKFGNVFVFTNPDEAARKQLVDDLKIDEHTLASALDPDEQARIEFEPEHIAIIYKQPKNYSGADQLLFKVTSTGLFLFKDRLIIVVNDDTALFDKKKLQKASTVNDFALRMIYGSIYHFLEHIKIITSLTESLENKINKSLENKYLTHLFTLQKSLVYYLNAICANGVLIERLKNNAVKIGFQQEQLELIDDMLIENNQCYRQAEIYSNILASLMDARASIVGNNLNILMKTLNIITIGIMVPTLVVSIFSMNVAFPFRDHPSAFWMIISLAAISVGGVMYWWKKKQR